MTPEELWRQYVIKSNEAAKLVAEITAESNAHKRKVLYVNLRTLDQDRLKLSDQLNSYTE
jgi:hypothetical protein